MLWTLLRPPCGRSTSNSLWDDFSGSFLRTLSYRHDPPGTLPLTGIDPKHDACRVVLSHPAWLDRERRCDRMQVCRRCSTHHGEETATPWRGVVTGALDGRMTAPGALQVGRQWSMLRPFDPLARPDPASPLLAMRALERLPGRANRSATRAVQIRNRRGHLLSSSPCGISASCGHLPCAEDPRPETRSRRLLDVVLRDLIASCTSSTRGSNDPARFCSRSASESPCWQVCGPSPVSPTSLTIGPIACSAL